MNNDLRLYIKDMLDEVYNEINGFDQIADGRNVARKFNALFVWKIKLYREQ